MTTAATAPSPVAPRLGYGISDADQHFYEAPDSVTRYLEKEHLSAFRWIEVDGRTMLMLNDRLYRLVPNPTYDPVSPPGSMVEYFRGQNQAGRSLREIAGKPQPLDPAFRYREPRMKVLDEQGIELCIMLPTQVLGLEEMLWENPAATAACIRALNRWTHEEWGWNIDDRVLTVGAVTLIEPEAAEVELERILNQGCRVIGLRPGPVQAPGVRRSIADPVYDGFWARAAEAGVVVAFHSADTPYGGYLEAWGEPGRWVGHKPTAFAEVLGIHTERPIYDTMAAVVAHGLFDRHPTLRIAALELGAGWVPPLVRRLRIAYGKTPQAFGRDPVESFIDHTWVMPFYEDDLVEITHYVPVERLIFGSDYPHPEGLSRPEDYIDDLAAFTPEQQRLIMRDNLRALALG